MHYIVKKNPLAEALGVSRLAQKDPAVGDQGAVSTCQKLQIWKMLQDA